MVNLNNLNNFYFVLIYALRDLHKSYKRLISVILTFFFSLLIYSTILTINESLKNELIKNQKVLLGGDIEIDYNRNVGNQKLIDQVKNFSDVSHVLEFNSMISRNNKSVFTRIKSVDSQYPLYGSIETFPKSAFKRLKSNDDLILLNKNIFENLDLGINEEVLIQGITFKVAGYIKKIPDIGGAFIFGDYAIISNLALKKLDLNNLGNLINNEYKIKFHPGINSEAGLKKINLIFKNENNLNIKLPSSSGRGLKIIISNFSQFLSLLSISALLISGVGIANSFLSYLNEKYISIAIKKSLGINNFELKCLYLFQIFMLLFFSSLFSYCISLYFIPILNIYLNNYYDLKLENNFSVIIYLKVLFVGFMVMLITSIPTLSAISYIKGSDLLKNAKRNINFIFNKKTIIWISLLFTFFVIYISYYTFKPLYSIYYFIIFLLCLLTFFFMNKLLILFLKSLNIKNNISLKFAFEEIIRPKSLSSIILITLGLGTTLLLSLGLVGFNIKKEISKSIPKVAPDYFFLGLQKNQKDIFENFLYKLDAKAKINSMPMVSAKLIKINGVDPFKYINSYNDSYWFINNDRRISWSNEAPENNKITDGVWWESNQKNSNELFISLDKKIAKDLNINLGDKFTLLISGREVLGTVKNFREVNYRDLNINFAMIINSSFAKKLPSQILSTVKFENVKNFNTIKFLEKFPNVSYIEIKSYVKKISNLLNNIYLSVSIVTLIITIIGFFVIVSAVMVQNKIKVYQNLVFKIIGLSKKQIILVSIYEFIILYLFTIFLSTFFSILISKYTMLNLFQILWEFDIRTFLYVIFVITFLNFFLIIYSNFKNLSPKIYPLIRNE